METQASGVKRAELIAALSLALDLATGESMERSFRTCFMAQRLGVALVLSPAELRETYYLSLLKFLGCTSDAETAARIFGDEHAIMEWVGPAMGGGQLALMTAMVTRHGAGMPPQQRLAAVAKALMGMPAMSESSRAHCEVAQRLAARMGFDEQTCERLTQVFEYWNGSGEPNRLKGEQICLPVRLVTLAEDVQLFERLGGVDAAVAMARKRAGKAYDPQVTEMFCERASAIFDDINEAASWASLVDLEPEPKQALSQAELDTCLEALADFCDLKSRYFLGHSTAVADLAAGAGRNCGLSEPDVVCLRRAALVHEIGMAGISSSIVDKETPLTEREEERLRLHSYYTERVLARPAALAQFGGVAAMHHERLDGSGYHHGAIAAMQPLTARILIAACAYQTEVSPQPGRAASTPLQASTQLQREAEAGKLDREAVNAVLAAAGHLVKPARRTLPAGLSEREVEVLRLLARGLSRKQIAGELVIADKTVARHIENIYNKLGLNTRPGATLFALENGLLAR